MICPIIVLIGVLFAAYNAFCGDNPSAHLENSRYSCEPSSDYPAEECVLSKLRKGMIADLADCGNVISNKLIRACVLEYVLTSNWVPHQGVHVKNAVVAGDLDLANIEIAHRITLEDCKFTGTVDLSSTHFAKDISFAGSLFSQRVFFDESKIEGDLDLSCATFSSDANFEHLEVGGDLDGGGAWFQGETVFTGLKVTHRVAFDSGPALFKAKMAPGSNDVASADVLETFETHNKAISQDSYLLPVNPSGGQWRILDNRRQHAYSLWRKPDGVEVKRTTYFKHAFDMSGASVAKQFTASDACFHSDAIFDSVKIDDSANLDYSYFGGRVSWGFAVIANQLSAKYARFRSAEQNVNFYRVQCAEADLRGSVFSGGVDFGNASVLSEFQAQDAVFASPRASDFFGLKVSGPAYFQRATFAGPVSFILVQVGGNLDVSHAHFDDHTGAKELADRTRTTRPFTFNADFGSIKVDGFAFFYGASFAGALSFRNATFQNLFLDNISWRSAGEPRITNPLRLEGMTFRRIRSVREELPLLTREELDESWANLNTTFREHTPYTYDIYHNVEAYFRAEGEPDIADNVFIEGKDQERIQALKPYSLSWCLNWFLGKTVGFGRRPLWAGYWSLGWIIFGSILLGVFMHHPKSDAVAPNTLHHKIFYCGDCFWYSFGLFLPVIKLDAYDGWKPKKGRHWIEWYIYLHTIIGLILVPIWLAALAGLIK